MRRVFPFVGVAIFAFILLPAMALGQESKSEGPTAMLESVTDEMLSSLREQRERIDDKPERLFELVDEVLVPHVDVELMSRWVLGRYWRQATPEQRQRFTQEFQTLMVRFYVSALLDDPKQLDEILATEDIITYLPAQVGEEGKRALVRSRVNLASGQVVPVTFSLYRPKDKWLVYDVNVEGISVVTNYRNSFGSEIRAKGLDQLIQDLAEQNKRLLETTRENGRRASAEGKSAAIAAAE